MKLFTCRVAAPPPRTSTVIAAAGTYAGSSRPEAGALGKANSPPRPLVNHDLAPTRQVHEVAHSREDVHPSLHVEGARADLHAAGAGER